MERKKIPYQKTVFVCVNQREDGRPSCADSSEGGAELCKALKEAVKAAGLKGKIRVASSGCLDLCAQGPNLFIYPDGVWKSRVKLADIPQILSKLGIC